MSRVVNGSFLVSVGIDAVHLDDRRALREVSSNNDLREQPR